MKPSTADPVTNRAGDMSAPGAQRSSEADLARTLHHRNQHRAQGERHLRGDDPCAADLVIVRLRGQRQVDRWLDGAFARNLR
ncbi:hypothetical protein BS329_18260 [Amycolatopsis coloradensis]|uniref:Uncharacterized protein n=1 Tax=Amycolatopsis coloradensis TaxID=76021 RepID=A0A1R0KRB7_9PSEU|nr:hypothetical protein [Amycolatopsis coloradensis]OLZ50393.1 hypothetical protein BS329_18260 [Amycolatopsis coloradensis]